MAFSFKALLFKIFMSDLIPLNKNATMLIGYDQDDDGIPDDFDFATADDLKESTDAIKEVTDKQADLLKDAFLFTKAKQGKDEAGKPIITLSNNNGDEFKFSIGGGGGGGGGTYSMTLTAPYLNLLENEKVISRVELPIENGKWLGIPPIGGTEIMTGDIIHLGPISGLNMSTVYDTVTRKYQYSGVNPDYVGAVFHQVNMPKDFKADSNFSLDTKIELKLTHLVTTQDAKIDNLRSDNYYINDEEIMFDTPYITTWGKISAPGSKNNILKLKDKYGDTFATIPVFTTSRFGSAPDHIKVFDKEGAPTVYNAKIGIVYGKMTIFRVGFYDNNDKLINLESANDSSIKTSRSLYNKDIINGMLYVESNYDTGLYNITYGEKTFSILIDDSDIPVSTASGAWATKGTTAYQIAQTIFTRLTQDLGISGAAAAGVMGNIAHESRFDPSAENDSDGGHGLIQWTFGRRDELVRRAGQAGTSINDLNIQIDYLIYEMKQPSNWVSAMWTDNSLAKFGMCTDPQEAAMRFYVSQMEAGGGQTGDPDGTGPQRKAYAQKVYEVFA